MSNLNLVFVSGLTGVGKSTTLGLLQDDVTVLPNRRELTDSIIIPAVRRSRGEPEQPVSDRLERFELTKAYRETHPGGIIQALLMYLQANPPQPPLREGESLVFDNVRGLPECRAALETFPNSRYIFLDAPPLVRLRRILGREDSFDTVGEVNAARLENTSFIERLTATKGADKVFDLYEVARFEANAGLDDDKILGAVSIIAKEHENYDSSAAASFLKENLSDKRLLYVDTSLLGVNEVAAAIRSWL